HDRSVGAVERPLAVHLAVQVEPAEPRLPARVVVEGGGRPRIVLAHRDPWPAHGTCRRQRAWYVSVPPTFAAVRSSASAGGPATLTWNTASSPQTRQIAVS